MPDGLPGGVGTTEGKNRQAKQMAVDMAKLARDLGLTLQDAASKGGWLATAWTALVNAAEYWLVLSIFLGSKVITAVLRIIMKARINTIPEQLEISAAVLSEFLGVEIAAPEIRTGQGKDGAIAAAEAIGRKLHGRLEQEFTRGGAVTEETGKAAAATFSGFAVNFGVQNALISMLADSLSDHRLAQFRELGVETARNLGLGRLQRQALGPLIRNTIAEPYDRYLRKKYRQDHLSERQLVTALHRGTMTLAQVQDFLAQKGYPDAQITELLEQLTSHLTDSELQTLIRWGKATREEAIKQLQNEGWKPEDAQRKLDAIEISKVESVISSYVNWLETRAISGEISLQAFQLLIDRLPLSPLQKEWENRVVGAQRETPRTRLTLAQMRTAFFTGLITLDEWDAFLDREGYSGQDATLLTYQLLHDAIYATERERRKAVLLKRGVDHLLSFSQVKSLFKSGVWGEDRVKQWLDEEGFSPQDGADLFILITSEASGSAGRAALPTLRAGQPAPESGQGAESG